MVLGPAAKMRGARAAARRTHSRLADVIKLKNPPEASLPSGSTIVERMLMMLLLLAVFGYC